MTGRGPVGRVLRFALSESPSFSFLEFGLLRFRFAFPFSLFLNLGLVSLDEWSELEINECVIFFQIDGLNASACNKQQEKKSEERRRK